MSEKGLSYSLIFHAALLLFAAFGLPNLFERNKDFMPTALTVEIVPVGDITNLPNKPKPISKPKQAESKKETPKPVAKTETPKPKAVPKDAVAPPEKTEPSKEKPSDTLKKESEKKAEEADELAALLDKLADESESAEDAPKDDTAAPDNASKSDYAYDDSLPLSLSEKDAVRNQFYACWSPPVGAKNAQDLAVNIRIKLARSGHVEEALVDPKHKSRYGSDSFFRTAVDAATRAVWKCSPLKNLPADKYGSWSEIEINFDPSEMLY